MRGGRRLRRRKNNNFEYIRRNGFSHIRRGFVRRREISIFNKKKLTAYRRFDIGFVFQFYNLVQNLTTLENVELASQICKDPLDAMTVLGMAGLKDRAGNFPAQRDSIGAV